MIISGYVTKVKSLVVLKFFPLLLLKDRVLFRNQHSITIFTLQTIGKRIKIKYDYYEILTSYVCHMFNDVHHPTREN